MMDQMDLIPSSVMEMSALSNLVPVFETSSAQWIRTIDGDTHVMLRKLRKGLWEEEKVRLLGLDCPEESTPEGKVATTEIRHWLAWRSTSPFNLYANDFTILHLDKRDKYGRLLGIIRSTDVGQELNAWIIEKNFVKKVWTLPRMKSELGMK